MKTAGLFDTKNRLSEICDRVARTGEPLLVTRRGKPLVRIVPVVEAMYAPSVWDTVEESIAKYGALPKDGLPTPGRRVADNRTDPLED